MEKKLECETKSRVLSKQGNYCERLCPLPPSPCRATKCKLYKENRRTPECKSIVHRKKLEWITKLWKSGEEHPFEMNRLLHGYKNALTPGSWQHSVSVSSALSLSKTAQQSHSVSQNEVIHFIASWCILRTHLRNIKRSSWRGGNVKIKRVVGFWDWNWCFAPYCTSLSLIDGCKPQGRCTLSYKANASKC